MESARITEANQQQAKKTLLKALETFLDMAQPAELEVLSGLFDVQLRKACFMRKAHEYGLTGEGLERFHRDFIEVRELEVAEHKSRLDAIYAADKEAARTKH